MQIWIRLEAILWSTRELFAVSLLLFQGGAFSGVKSFITALERSTLEPKLLHHFRKPLNSRIVLCFLGFLACRSTITLLFEKHFWRLSYTFENDTGNSLQRNHLLYFHKFSFFFEARWVYYAQSRSKKMKSTKAVLVYIDGTVTDVARPWRYTEQEGAFNGHIQTWNQN